MQSIGIGPIQTATILAAIGSTENFPNAGSLKSSCGWSPTVVQSGTTLDSAKQTRGGTRTMKQIMYLIVIGLIPRDTEWARLYERLVQASEPLFSQGVFPLALPSTSSKIRDASCFEGSCSANPSPHNSRRMTFPMRDFGRVLRNSIIFGTL